MCAGHACTAVALRAAVASNHKTEQSICACDSRVVGLGRMSEKSAGPGDWLDET